MFRCSGVPGCSGVLGLVHADFVAHIHFSVFELRVEREETKNTCP